MTISTTGNTNHTMRIIWGELLYGVIFAGSCTHFLWVVALATGEADHWTVWFGTHWPQQGFCISFPNTYYDSHYLSFYADVLLVLTMKYLVSTSLSESKPRKTTATSSMHPQHPAITVLQGHIPSLLGHGGSHLILTAYFEGSTGMATLMEKSTYTLVTAALLLAFFVNFIQKPFPWSPPLLWAQAIFHTVVAGYWLPGMFLFTYVSFVYNINLCTFRLGYTPRHSAFYTQEALIARLPIMIMTWLEPLLCDSFWLAIGGHMYFDITIPLSAIAFYFYVRDREYDPNSTVSTTNNRAASPLKAE